jgi:glycosyltransferase involved in cell wall biosynthesis
MEGGGSERQMALLIRNLDRSRFAPELYLQRRTGPHLHSIPNDVPIHSFDEQKKTTWLNWPGRIRGQQIRHLRQTIQHNHFDLVFDRALHMTQLTGPATAGLNVARISTVVASPIDDFEFYEKRFRWIKRKLLAKAYLEADRVLAVSHSIAREMQGYYHVPSDRVTVLYSPIDQEQILAASTENIADYTDIPNAELRVLCLGRITEVKRQQDVYDAAKYLIQEKQRRIQIDFVGDGPLKINLEEQAKRDGLTTNIRFHGFRTNPFPFYRHTDLLCLASNCEGLPNVIMEAMFLGVPVLACDCSSGPKELLGEQKYGTLVPVKDPRALAMAMLDRIDRPQVWLDKAKLAAQIASERHQLPTWLKSIENLFEDVVRRRKMR